MMRGFISRMPQPVAAAARARCRRAAIAPAWCSARSARRNAGSMARPARRVRPSGPAWCRTRAPAASGGRPASVSAPQASRPDRHGPRAHPAVIARRIVVRGRVQGVGYRPFVLRLALATGVRGWVRNRGGEVDIHAEGSAEQPGAVRRRAHRRRRRRSPFPKRARRRTPRSSTSTGFRSGTAKRGPRRTSRCRPITSSAPIAWRRWRDPAARRFRYPFTNCTQCGPRYTIIDQSSL